MKINNQEIDSRLYYDRNIVTGNRDIKNIKNVYHGITYYISSDGSFPRAYVKIPSNHIFNGKAADDNIFDDVVIKDSFITHCNNDFTHLEEKGWYICWDYGHACDFIYYGAELLNKFPEDLNDRRFTVEMLEDACKEFIDKYMLGERK